MNGKILLALLSFLVLLPYAFADVMSPFELVLLPGIVLAVPFINYFFNFAVMFIVQKLCLKSFFSRIPLKQVLAAVVWVTGIGWLLDAAAVVFLSTFSTILWRYLDSSLLPYFYFLSTFLFLFVGQFLLLRRLKFGSRKEAVTLALALGLFTNPALFQLATGTPPPIILPPTASIILVSVLGFVLMAVYAVKRQASKEEALKNRKLVFGLLLLFLYALLSISTILAFPDFFSHGTDVLYCSSSQPSKINVVSHSFGDARRETKIGDLVITNVTGGQITSVDLDCDTGLFASHDDVLGNLDGDASDVLPVGNSTIPIFAGVPGYYPWGAINISYTDTYGNRQSAEITCQGGEIMVS